MRKWMIPGTLGILLALMGCSSVAIDYDFDPAADFSKYRTYHWVDEDVGHDVLAQMPLVKDRIKNGIDLALKNKGFIRQDPGETDFAVAIHGKVKTTTQITEHGDHGYHPWWGPYGGHVDVSTYDEGTVVIDIVDWSTKKLSWRGLITKIIEESPGKDQAKINRIAADVMANFPPK
jgi:hypothetical protein